MSGQQTPLSAIILHPELTDMDKLLWLFILDMATTRNLGAEGSVALSVTGIARQLGRSRGAISKGVSKLADLDLIRRTDQKNGNNFVYTVKAEYALADQAPALPDFEHKGFRLIRGGAA